MKTPPSILATQVLAQTRNFQIESQELRFANGAERTYERLVAKGLGAVLVVPLLDDETFLLIREWAAGTGRYELGFPKGKIDAGETPEQAALREGMEEVGYGARQLTCLHVPLTLSPAYMTHNIHVVLAESLYPAKAEGDEPEPLDVVPWRWDDLDALMMRDDFTEARSIAALWLVKRHLASRSAT
ncbi:MAG: ADP compounds hydrolase NudE [Gammaproteobacteria bacterium]|nr:ADP compounds hydrolase NudE [Gammaproteobacteria bacterium]